ncbi:TPA: hypothetical protein ACH3X1_011751 [Trebouxia sp. C0004]
MASLMGYFHSARRNQPLSRTTIAMTAIKMHLTSTDKNRRSIICAVQIIKPVRDIEAILQREFDAAEHEEKETVTVWLRTRSRQLTMPCA